MVQTGLHLNKQNEIHKKIIMVGWGECECQTDHSAKQELPAFCDLQNLAHNYILSQCQCFNKTVTWKWQKQIISNSDQNWECRGCFTSSTDWRSDFLDAWAILGRMAVNRNIPILLTIFEQLALTFHLIGKQVAINFAFLPDTCLCLRCSNVSPLFDSLSLEPFLFCCSCCFFWFFSRANSRWFPPARTI